jgi:hypothetical protein
MHVVLRFTAMTINNIIVKDSMLCSLVDGHLHSGGLYRLHLHGKAKKKDCQMIRIILKTL